MNALLHFLLWLLPHHLNLVGFFCFVVVVFVVILFWFGFLGRDVGFFFPETYVIAMNCNLRDVRIPDMQREAKVGVVAHNHVI